MALTKQKEIFFSCGDPSGDLHAANLAKAIKKLDPSIRISAMGGERIKGACDNFIYNLVDLNVHGFFEPLKRYPGLRSSYNMAVAYLKNEKPDIFIPVDYYGFNIKVSEAAKQLSIPVHFYISPQVWASRAGRIKKIKENITHMHVLFPFEEQIYKKAGIPVSFTGHPFLDTFPEIPDNRLKTNECTVGIFPGSRRSVIKWNLPNMLETAKLVQKKMPEARFVIAGMEPLKHCYDGCDLEVIFDKDYKARKKFTLALCTSGTVTLENALLNLPMIVTYKLPALMYYLIKSMILVDSITIVNLICNEKVVPEFIQNDAKPEVMADMIIEWLSNKRVLEEKIMQLKHMRSLLGAPGAYERTARLILGK